MSKQNGMNRREFIASSLKISAGALAFPCLLPSSALGRDGSVAPSNRVVLGCIGVGGMGVGNMRDFLQLDDVRVVAVCDVDAENLEKARELVNERYGNTDCAAYRDFRELVARDDIDAVSIATPDHWHGITAVTAAESGKDIYGEKPLSHSVAEGRAICAAVKRHNRIWQTGSWQRSVAQFRFACELVRNGRIGKVHSFDVGLPSGHDIRGSTEDMAIQDPPEVLDYDFWLGPAPHEPYFPARTHWNWRWHLDYGGGQLLDWVGHHVDIAHWGLGMDRLGPVEIEGFGEYPKASPFNSATRYRVTTRYKNGIKMTIAGGHEDIRMGSKWIGEDGWVWVRRGRMETVPKSLMREKIGPEEVRLYDSSSHHRNFIDCVKSRRETIAPAEVAHRSQTPGHLGLIAMTLGRKIRFNPETEEIVDDPTASRMLRIPMRSPWYL